MDDSELAVELDDHLADHPTRVSGCAVCAVVARHVEAHDPSFDLSQYEVRQQGDWIALACIDRACGGRVLSSWRIVCGLDDLLGSAVDHERREIRE